MIGVLFRLLVRSLAFLPWLLACAWRRRWLGKRAVVEIEIGGGRPDDLSQRLAREAAVRRLARDGRVRAVRLVVRSAPMSWASVQALREALGEVHAAGKPVIAVMDTATDRGMCLVGGADAVWMPPSGEVMLCGIAAQVPFYGPALKRLGVKMSIESAGVFKSLGEPYTRGFPSTANREAMGALLNDLHEQLVHRIAEDRDLELDVVREAQRTGPHSAEQALALGLIDRIGYADEVAEALKDAIGGEPRVRSLERYARWSRVVDSLARMGRRRPRVAVVHLQGAVVQSRGAMARGKPLIAAEEVVPVLDELIENRAVAAVVLVVDSPGGSALASDLIARSVVRLNDKKPVVVHMDGVAASGGYFIAAPAREIIAQPGTITGSIGVVGGKVVLGPGLAKWGVHVEQIGPGQDASMNGTWSDFDDDQRQRYRSSLSRVYERFLAVVAEGRSITRDQAHAVAQGRVWTGVQAKERGLVDHVGGLQFAVRRVMALAELDEGPVRKLHIKFAASRWGALSMFLGGVNTRSTPDALDLALSAIGPAGWLPRQVRQAPGEPLAVAPAVLDEVAWLGWGE